MVGTSAYRVSGAIECYMIMSRLTIACCVADRCTVGRHCVILKCNADRDLAEGVSMCSMARPTMSFWQKCVRVDDYG